MRVLCTMVLLAGGLLFPVFSEKREMTYDRYLTELTSTVQREKTAREEIAGEQSRIESLRQQISELSLRIAGVIQEEYTILGITEADVVSAETDLSNIKNELQRFSYMSSDESASRRQEIERIAAQFAALKQKRVCLLFRVAEKVRDVEPVMAQVLRQLRQATAQPQPIPPPPSSTYTVGSSGKGRNLSLIAAEVYGDQFQWPRIYRANKELIDKWYARYKNGDGTLAILRPQDFVLPGWTLEIPR